MCSLLGPSAECHEHLPIFVPRQGGEDDDESADGPTPASPMSAEAAWDVMEKAHHARANVAQAIRLKDDDASLGCSSSRAEVWAQKKNQMYCERTTAVFTHTYHWNLVADPGTHTYKEVMPAVLYNWEEDMGCYTQFQYLLQGKGGVTAADCQMEDDIETLAQEMKLERVASYRQLQGPFIS